MAYADDARFNRWRMIFATTTSPTTAIEAIYDDGEKTDEDRALAEHRRCIIGVPSALR